MSRLDLLRRRYAYRTNLKRQLSEHPDEYAVVKLIGPVISAVQGVVQDQIDVFASTRQGSAVTIPTAQQA